MSISAIGSSCSYIYNLSTGKLSTKDGSEDEFVNYFNGEISAEESSTLNGFDGNRKRDIERMIMFFSGFSGGVAKDIFNEQNGTEYEITDEIVDAVTSTYSVNGEKIFTAYTGLSYLPEEIEIFTTITQPYKTRQSKAYDPLTNSINIAVGDKFDFGNGYKLTVMEDRVYGEGYGNGSIADDNKMNSLVGGVNALIHFADQQWMAAMIDDGAGSTELLLALLQDLGVDTSREFTINETKCQVVNGKIREVGNKDGIPSTIYNEALNRYEERLYQPLSTGWYVGA